MKNSLERNFHNNDVLMVDFGEHVGSIQDNIRPALLVQNDIGNKYSSTLIVIPITSAMKRLEMKTHVSLSEDKYKFLVYESEALCEQITTVNKFMVRYKLGTIDREDRERINSAIRFAICI